MKIVGLEIENFKRLKAVSIRPDGAVVSVRGRNGAGKTSVLDGIAAAIGGEALCPAEPIRRGAERARVMVELDDLQVERKWSSTGSRLEVRSKEGAVFKSPQKLLDGLVGKLTFDPLAFLREKPERQAEILRQLVGIDFTLLDGKRRQLYDARTEANRRTAAARARLDALPAVEAPEEPVSSAALLEEQQRRSERHAANERKRQDLGRLRDEARRAAETVRAASGRVADLEQQLVQARRTVDLCRQEEAQVIARGQALRAEVEALQDPDLDEIPAKLREVEAVNDRVRQQKARAGEAEQLRQAEAESARLSSEIEAVDARKAEALTAAQFPVAGLGFGEVGVTLSGLPLEQASSAEQLRVSVATGLALNPKLKVLLVRDGSLLDEESLALLARMAEQAGAQVWLEVVSKGGVGVTIEDGQVDGVAASAEAAHA